MSEYKIYVDVLARFTSDGQLRPLAVIWRDGRIFSIEKVLGCERAVSRRAGGTGIRYSCRMCGKVHYLYYEENNKWFVEKK